MKARVLLSMLLWAGMASAGCAEGETIIADHTAAADFALVPRAFIEKAKADLRICYGHTSHGSQVITGMQVLMHDPSSGGLYDLDTDGAIQAGVLSVKDRTPTGDLGNPDRTSWASRTRDYLKGAGRDRNVV
ncbi:MAG: hypothetical protein DRP79_10060, partial [Planctomycetota bacterium]